MDSVELEETPVVLNGEVEAQCPVYDAETSVEDGSPQSQLPPETDSVHLEETPVVLNGEVDGLCPIYDDETSSEDGAPQSQLPRHMDVVKLGKTPEVIILDLEAQLNTSCSKLCGHKEKQRCCVI